MILNINEHSIEQIIKVNADHNENINKVENIFKMYFTQQAENNYNIRMLQHIVKKIGKI